MEATYVNETFEETVIEENENVIDITTLDLLDRQPFVDQVIRVVELLAAQRNNTCFAINGEWGIGKSFVLKMIEDQLSIIQNEENTGDKYIIFHYNCWQYDYYEEPIVAIVAAMLEQISSKTEILSSSKREIVTGVLKAVGSYLLKKGAKHIKDVTGLPADEMLELCIEGTKEGIESIDKNNEFDSNFKFRQALVAFQKQIESLAEDYTVVFVVDELDRCLPEYAIKVLERLHHLFEGVPNTQIILSIDKNQLEHTIENIFGKRDNFNVAERYLSKFIKFQIDLSEGEFTYDYEVKFSHYLSRFGAKSNDNIRIEIMEYLINIFNGIDIRNRIEIIDKCNLLHSMIIGEKGYMHLSYMCVEILFTIMYHVDYDFEKGFKTFRINEAFIHGGKSSYGGLKFMNSKVQEQSGIKYYASEGRYSVVRTDDIWGMLLAISRYVGGIKNDEYSGNIFDMNAIKNHAGKYYELLKTIH